MQRKISKTRGTQMVTYSYMMTETTEKMALLTMCAIFLTKNFLREISIFTCFSTCFETPTEENTIRLRVRQGIFTGISSEIPPRIPPRIAPK